MDKSLSQKIIIESLAMDLKRVALGYYRGSLVMAKRFQDEALKRARELEKQNCNAYIQKLLILMKKAFKQANDKLAEDALMLSTLFQNFAMKNF